MRSSTGLGLAILVSSAVLAQDAFEVATIKPTDPDYRGGVVNTPPGGMFTSRGIPLKFLIAIAYDVNVRQVSGGPSWLESDRYDVIGKAPDTSGNLRMDTVRPMLRSLFAERLRLVVRLDKREMPVYALVVGKNGHKLRAHEENGGSAQLLIQPGAKLPARNATMTEFSFLLQNGVLDRPVLDRTGLVGRYDFDLTWDESGLPDSNLPSIFTAVQEQLGLRLEPERGIADEVVLEHVERPGAN
jgi:uncharacterized protein (TIGR03435 family)